MRARGALALGAAALLCGVGLSAWQGGGASERQAQDAWAPRLAGLSPERPADYYALGEEVADAGDGVGDRLLATRLFVLALELDRAQRLRAPIAASACLALAELSASSSDDRWLGAIASLLDPGHSSPPWAQRPGVASTEEPEYRLALLLGALRAGDGLLARKLLAEPDVQDAMRRFDSAMTRLGIAAANSTFEREAQRWPCRECGNERVVRRPRSVPPEYRLCPHCGGKPGVRLSAEEFLSHLRMESWLLQGDQRSWAAQMGMDGASPLRDPEAGEVARVFQVDPSLVIYRDGAWIADPARVVVPGGPVPGEAPEGVPEEAAPPPGT